MAERRMFAKTIVLSDAFLDMPMSARCLYFTLGMLADDDGFVNSPRAIMRQCGASDDDMKLLIAKKFVLIFESGIIVIKHWRINNYLQNDRITPTKHFEEKAKLEVTPNRSYRVKADVYTEDVYTDKNRLDKNSLVKDRLEKGEYEGETSPSTPNAPACQPPPVLTDEEKKERIEFYIGRIRFFQQMTMGDGECWYTMAATEGITRDEIDRALESAMDGMKMLNEGGRENDGE